MAKPEKDRKDEPKKKDEQLAPPELGAILPEKPMDSPHDLLADIDSYQEKIDQQWEATKSQHQRKINEIMDQFVKEKMIDESTFAVPDPAPKPAATTPPSPAPTASMESILARVEKTLRETENRTRRLSYYGERPSIINLSWQPFGLRWRQIFSTVLFFALGVTAGAYYYAQNIYVRSVNDLPYTHTAGPVMIGQKIYIADWLRKGLFVHARRPGLPILSVENVPNGFLTGFAISDKNLWTVDGFSRKIIQHSMTPDHQVVSEFTPPGQKPGCLFWDNTDLWMGDSGANALYQFHGTDISEVRQQYEVPIGALTGFQIRENRVYALDGHARIINIYRLQTPLKQIASFDLDRFLNGATPTGLALATHGVWVVTDGPSRLLYLSFRQLKKSHPDDF